MKILIVRFSSIGDIVLTTPVVRCVKLQTGAEVHYLTKSAYKSLLSDSPYIDKHIFIDKEITEVTAQLKTERYDLILDLHHNLRTWRLKQQIGVPSASFHKLNKEKWLLTNLKIDRLPPIHIVDRYLATAKQLGVENDGNGLDYFIPKQEEIDVTSLGNITPGNYLTFVIGAKHGTKRLPNDKISAIIKKLDSPVVLIGGKEDLERGKTIQFAERHKIINACGSLNINQSASVIRQSKAVITHDTGMMHIAAALKKPIVSIWGNTVPKFGMTPYYPQGAENFKIIENNTLRCRPCSKIGYPTCPKKHFNCMNDIPSEEVIMALQQLI